MLRSGMVRGMFITCAFLLSALLANAQLTGSGNWSDKLVSDVKQFTQTFVPQKVHLHTAGSFYAPSDTVWFKAYLVDAASFFPIKGYEVITIRLISEGKALVLTQQVSAFNGLAAGQLVLPDSLLPGNYTLVAYTNWMRNFSPEFFFRQPLTILKPTADKGTGSKKHTLAALRFFPESGNLVSGLKSKVGFKALDSQGLGLPVEGQILDEAGKVLVNFKSLQAGMGNFTFTPAAGKKYSARVTFGNKQSQTFALPQVQSSGLVLTVAENPDNSSLISLAVSPDRARETFYVAVQSRGFILFLEEMKGRNAAKSRLKIDKNEMRDGIAQVTVFNEAGTPEAERLFFVNNQRRFQVQLTPEKAVYNRREQVKVHVKVTGENGEPLQTELSLAVSDLNQTGPLHLQQSIFSSLLLTSDLAGNIETPGSYFENNQPETREALDNLMLTQGWRRFTWNQIADAGKTRPAFKREPEMVLHGTVENNKYPVAQAVIYLLDHKTGESEVIVTDADGKFSMHSGGNRATQQYAYQVWQNGNFLRNAEIRTAPETEIAWPDLFAANTADTLLLQRNMMRSQIEKAYGLKLKKSEATTAPVKNKNWLVTPPDKTYALEKYEALKDFEEVLKEIVPDVRVLIATAEPETRMVSKDKRDFNQHPPMYFIDGQPTWNDELILRLNTDLIKEVSVYNSSRTLKQFGSIGSQGVIAIQTKAGNFHSPELEAKNRITVPGVMPAREFYVPPVNTQVRMPDLRPVLYWNPSLRTDAEGNAVISFPSSDAASNFRIYAEGITGSGAIGNGSVYFKSIVATQ
ncbi:hypothetical protein I5M27_09805 [Adhaeribacter sp. BT258]|uniref:MG2 domain-containing protein n=1 Tax=Adhaeribacter terrigena TaxID=2793070 RepID=A0ABS1C418_9BACT|nr:hypothetical protein [Adhaeribacter terrigena]MBK0403280.1 hypothetical protein [Adhaeribacter terrigena]